LSEVGLLPVDFHDFRIDFRVAFFSFTGAGTGGGVLGLVSAIVSGAGTKVVEDVGVGGAVVACPCLNSGAFGATKDLRTGYGES
jgi:hypothetical protein